MKKLLTLCAILFSLSVGATERIMSYNIRNCRGMDEKVDYDRIAAIINSCNADVVALQELDSVTTRSGGVDVLKELSLRTAMYGTFSKGIDFQGGSYGIGLLSKVKPLSVKRVSLPGREERRSLLIAEFENYIFCVTHLSTTLADAHASIDIISDLVKDYDKPVILAGDLNIRATSDTYKHLNTMFEPLSDIKAFTIPSPLATQCIDYIMLYNGSPQRCGVVDRKVLQEKVASDHLPLYVDVNIGVSTDKIFRTEPNLQNPTDSGITVSWLTNVPSNSWVEYGMDPSSMQMARSVVDGQVICNNKHNKIRLEGLKPNTKYSYRVHSQEMTLYKAYEKAFGETATSPTYSFTTPPTQNGDFTAVIFNDLHKNKATFKTLSSYLKDTSHDFAIFNGDCIDDPKNEAEALDFMSYIFEGVNAQSKPIFYLRGNHEIRGAYSIELRDLLDYVGDKTYGAFSWGGSRFVMLDCGEDKPDSTQVYYNLNDFNNLRHAQIDFLKTELGSKEFKKAQGRILLHHIPIYGKGKAGMACKELWGDALAKAPFDICLNAHTHKFNVIEKGVDSNNFPVVVGGGPTDKNATVMILTKKNNTLNITVVSVTGQKLLDRNISL